MPGPNDYAIIGGSSARLFGGAGGSGNKVVYVTQPTTTLSVSVSMSFNFPVTKSGAGILALTGTTDQLNLSGTDPARAVYLNEGVLRASPGVNLGTNNVLAFRGGVLEIASGGTITRPLGNTVGAVNWDVGNFDGGSGGFSAINLDASVNIGGAGDPITWGQTNFAQDGSALRFGSVASTRTVTWQNPLALDGGVPGSYAVREIEVTRGSGSSTDKTKITGLISGSTSSDLVKTGTGVLELARPDGDTYAGSTLMFAGSLKASNTNPASSATGTGGITVGHSGILTGTGYLAPTGGKRVIILDGGTLSPGDPTGTLTVASALEFRNGASFLWSLSDSAPTPASLNTGTSSAAALRSQLTVTGTGNTLLADGITFRISELAPPTFVVGQTYSWLVADTAGTPTLGAVTFDLSAAPTFAAYGGVGQLSLQQSSTDVYLNFTPVPEPMGYLIAASIIFLLGACPKPR